MGSLIDMFANDDVNVRLQAVSKIKDVPPAEMSPIFKVISEDINMKVRIAAAQQIELCPSVFKMFVLDPEAKVREIVLKKSVEIQKAGLSTDQIIDAISTIVNDDEYIVRQTAADMLYKLVPKDEEIVINKITPLVEMFLQDKNDTVRIAAAKNVKELTVMFGYNFLFQNMAKSLHLLIADSQWRVRKAGMEIIFGLALSTSAEFFNSNLLPFLFSFLHDKAYKAREYAVSALPALASRFGEEWIIKYLYPGLQKMGESENYLYRILYLNAVSSLTPFFQSEYQSNYVFQPMIRMLKDNVDSVVLLAISLIGNHKDAIHPFRRQYELRPLLENLLQDRNTSIKEAAGALLEFCQ